MRQPFFPFGKEKKIQKKLCRHSLKAVPVLSRHKEGVPLRAFCRAMTFTFHAFVCAGLGCILASIYILR